MSSFFESSPALEYFNQLERWFIALRGAPQKLSADDFQVAKTWFEEGVPLDLVQAQIEEIVRKDRERDNELKSRLRFYCKPVERAFAERRRLQAPGTVVDAPSLDLEGRLRRLASRLENSLQVALGDAAAGFDGAARVASLNGDAEHIESELARLEDEILARAEAALDDAGRRDLARRRAEALERLIDRLPGGVPESAASRLHRQILRRVLDLPEMSLFGVDAAPAAGEQG